MGLEMAERNSSSDDETVCYRLIVRNVPDEVFLDNAMKENLEGLFLAYGSHATFDYMKSFRRLRVAFMHEAEAEAARSAMHGKMFGEHKLSVFRATTSLTELFKSGQFLKPPKVERTELISPPSSPPVGWVQVREEPPVVDYQLQAAVAGLAEEGSIVELYKGGGELPTINVEICA